MELTFGIISMVIASLALGVSLMSLNASHKANRSSIYDRRYEVYSDAEGFLRIWMAAGVPDMNELSRLVAAWSRSHFLFDQPVTSYLRELWLDSLKASAADSIINQDTGADHSKAVKEKYDLLQKHGDYEKLRAVFLKELKV